MELLDTANEPLLDKGLDPRYGQLQMHDVLAYIRVSTDEQATSGAGLAFAAAMWLWVSPMTGLALYRWEVAPA